MPAELYSPEDIDKALYALLALGSPSAASRALDEAFGLEIKPATLTRWRTATHAERYAQLAENHGADIEAAMVRELRDIVMAATGVMREAIEKTAYAVENEPHRIRPTEFAQIAASMAKVQQQAIDKMLALTGRPQSITENRSAAEIIRALEAKGVKLLDA